MATCPLCAFEACSVSIILSHLRAVHSNDANFSVVCGLGGCATTSQSFSALYSHIYRRHPDVIKKRMVRENSVGHHPIHGLSIDDHVDDTAIEG